MAARRRIESAEIRFGPALKALAACLLIACAAVGYVRQKHELTMLEGEGSKLKIQFDRLRVQNAAFQRQLDQLENPDYLGPAIRRRLPDLGPTRPGQVIWLPLVRSSEPVDGRAGLAGGRGR